MQSEEVVGAALAGRPTSEDGAKHSAYIANPKAEYGYLNYDGRQDHAVAWVIKRFRVSPHMAAAVATSAGLGGRSA